MLLWFAWKYLSLWYQQQPIDNPNRGPLCCDLLENIYLCGINNNMFNGERYWMQLWFAWKYLPLWYQQQLRTNCCTNIIGCDLLENIYLCGINNNSLLSCPPSPRVVICLKISTSVVSTTTDRTDSCRTMSLWFAWKYLPLWYQQQPRRNATCELSCCDLLENIYLCGINNNADYSNADHTFVVICLKISTSVVSTTTACISFILDYLLWFAWKYLPLRYQQQRLPTINSIHISCDLLENIYLCGINNNR